MKITITIKNEWSGKTYDISLDNQQKIATTLRVMRENLPESNAGNWDRTRSAIRKDKSTLEHEKNV